MCVCVRLRPLAFVCSYARRLVWRDPARQATPERWDAVLAEQVSGESATCSAQELAGVLQDKLGEVVLSMPAGSTVQSVVAEYLNELIGRVRALAAEQA